jgi:hypothetical protein
MKKSEGALVTKNLIGRCAAALDLSIELGVNKARTKVRYLLTKQ